MFLKRPEKNITQGYMLYSFLMCLGHGERSLEQYTSQTWLVAGCVEAMPVFKRKFTAVTHTDRRTEAAHFLNMLFEQKL